MIITGSELIALALRNCGAFGTGQTAGAEDTNDAKTLFNMIISEWNRERWLTYHLIDTAFVCNNSLNYTVGTGGDFDIPRPAQIKAAYVRQLVPSNPYNVDFWLTPIFSREDYSRIVLKNLLAGPSTNFFYDSAYPFGFVYPWPVCNDQYELHILTQEALPEIADLPDEIILPNEYKPALYWNLMVWLRNAYDLPERALDLKKASAALNVLRKSNTQVPSLVMPASLRRPRSYNVWSDSP